MLKRPVYAPVASPAPPSPATHQSATSSEIVPQLQNIVRSGCFAFLDIKPSIWASHRLQHGQHGSEAGPEEDRPAREECRVQPQAVCRCHHEDQVWRSRKRSICHFNWISNKNLAPWHHLEWPNFIPINTGSRGQLRSYSALARWSALVLSLKRTAGELHNYIYFSSFSLTFIYFSSFSITSIFLSFLDADDSVLGLRPESMPELCRSWDFPPSLKTSRSRTWWVYFWRLVLFSNFSVQVGSCDVKFPIRLEGLVLTHSQFSSYEPELFPGLIYRYLTVNTMI